MIEIANREVITGLARALKANVVEWYGPDAKLNAESATLRTYPYSFFVRFPVQVSAGKQTLLAKIHRKPHMATLNEALTADWLRSIARQEYEMTRVIWRAFEEENSPACTAVQPLGYMDPWNAILMRNVEGRALKKYLFRAPMLLRLPKAKLQLQEYLKSSVIWLRIFHQRVAGVQLARFPVSGVSDLMKDVLSKLSKKSIGQVDVRHYRSALSRQLDCMKDLQVPVALLHDDFQYSNILIKTDGRACVLDYALNSHGCTYSDLATLLIDPQTRGGQIWSGGRLLAPSFIRACNQTILTAYFDGESYQKKVLDFYCALAVLNKWSADEAELNDGWRKKLYPVLSRATRRYYAKLMAQYLQPFVSH